MMNRMPAVAGAFYPADSQELQTMVDDLLDNAKAHEPVPKAIIVPHAGYIYSGPIAASAYRLIQSSDSHIDRVVLLGPSHRVAFQGLAASSAATFTTPLGSVAVDSDAIQSLLQFPFVTCFDHAHVLEHSLEVHLPFLQRALDDFKLVPLVVGEASPGQVSQVLDALWGGDETLVVISSDLSHYHDYASAKKLDQNTSHLIENLDYEHLTYDSACGRAPVAGLLKLLRDKSLTIKTIDLRNSGDTAGDKRRVVGYGAYVVN
jgi:AmmeMemoRadiSam system protein B